MIDAVLLDRDRTLIVIAGSARETDLLAAIEDQETIRQRTIGHHVEIGACAFERAQIAAAALQSCPSTPSTTDSDR